MTTQPWQPARIIPVSGISGAVEQERRASSALLAVLGSVTEFGRALTKPLGAPAGAVETFIEVPFDLNGQRVQPDGLIRVTRGKRTWVALVEVKTGSNLLGGKQLEAYLDVAKEQGFDVVLTISNEIPPVFGVHPTKVDKRKTKKVALHHASWTYVLTQAVVQKVHRGVADPDQAWILGELIRYLEHPKSGAMEFEDMGQQWASVRQAVSAGTLRPGDASARDVATRWEQLVRYTCLRLGRELGTEIQPALSRRERETPAIRAEAQLKSLVHSGKLDGTLKIPDTAGEVTIAADLRARQVSASMTIEAPRTGRSKTRLNWIIRQLRSAPDSLRIDTFVMHRTQAATSELLQAVREDCAPLVPSDNREVKSFRLTLTAAMGKKRGHTKGSFVWSVLDVLDRFYETTVQQVKPWTPAPPRLKSQTPDVDEAAARSPRAEESELPPSPVVRVKQESPQELVDRDSAPS